MKIFALLLVIPFLSLSSEKEDCLLWIKSIEVLEDRDHDGKLVSVRDHYLHGVHNATKDSSTKGCMLLHDATDIYVNLVDNYELKDINQETIDQANKDISNLIEKSKNLLQE